MRRCRRSVLTAALLSALSGGCFTPVWPPIRDWLQCDECSDGELEAVVAVGKHAVGPLAIALRDGPSARQIQNVRARAQSDFEAARRFREGHAGAPDVAGSVLDADSFLTRYVAAYVDLFRERGLIGLSAIGTPAARDSIHQLWVRDSQASLGWSPALRAKVQAHDTGITKLKLTGPDEITLGQSSMAQVQFEGVLQNPTLVWSTSNASRLTVSASGELTGLALGLEIVRVCWIQAGSPTPALCSSRAIRIVP